MQTSPLPFWLMIVSIAIAVLPVWRSPMISSRWPRPIGMSASIALTPVWTGVSTALADDDARGDALDGPRPIRRERTLVVDRSTERVDDAPEQGLADGNLDDAPGRLDQVALLDRGRVAEDDRSDRVLLEVERHAHDAARELEKLGGEGTGKPVDLGDAVADLDHRPDVAGLRGGVELVDRRLDDADDLV